jgi:hypothetical protein
MIFFSDVNACLRSVALRVPQHWKFTEKQDSACDILSNNAVWIIFCPIILPRSEAVKSTLRHRLSLPYGPLCLQVIAFYSSDSRVLCTFCVLFSASALRSQPTLIYRNWAVGILYWGAAPFVGPEGSWPCSQKAGTCLCTEASESSSLFI